MKRYPLCLLRELHRGWRFATPSAFHGVGIGGNVSLPSYAVIHGVGVTVLVTPCFGEWGCTFYTVLVRGVVFYDLIYIGRS